MCTKGCQEQAFEVLCAHRFGAHLASGAQVSVRPMQLVWANLVDGTGVEGAWI